VRSLNLRGRTVAEDQTVSHGGTYNTLTLHRLVGYDSARHTKVSTFWQQLQSTPGIVSRFHQRPFWTVPVHPLDQFEHAWSSGEVPQLQPYAAILTELGEESAISELCQIDMEHRWRSTNAMVRKCFARDYMVDLKLTMLAGDAIELICWEYHVRNHWGDYPSFRAILEEWPQYRPALDAAIQQMAVSIARPIVMMSGTQFPQASFELDGVLEVGRQRTDEPAPFERVARPNGDRLIVAANSDASISRKQLAICRDSKFTVFVRNTSRNRAIAVIDLRILDAGESASCPLPARIHLGGQLILSIENGQR
jgi:hypothetical protein